MAANTPFHKVLVANRGEIARRVIRSARAAGYRTVAVHSSADAGAIHVREADQAVAIGGAAPAQSYLRISALIEAARCSGADAVHPGYGFLAEAAAFAAACIEAGLVFIGPSAAAIAAMGDKAGAKRLMRQAGVPCIPGYDGDDQDPSRLADEAKRIGFPVMIKARAGGGGRGMRRAESASAFAELLRSACSEAEHAFGDPRVILERALVEPRHIEIQVFADRHGNAVHLGERDCSVQRRHQKLIEESPSPAVSAALRERMGATAVAAVRAIGYEGAGTLEYLLDRDGDFFFMEMNTRLQVEHPVTEALTGIDLVDWQLRVAAGEPLPLHQAEIRFDGHAIEVRLCAEDTDAGFMPQSGTLALWRAPEGLRVEHALESGAEIPDHYDSMIAKVIAHGATREEARRKLLRGLEDDLVALGLETNQAFLARCLAHPAFVRGEATTAFIERHAEALSGAAEALDPRTVFLAGLLAAVVERERWPQAPGQSQPAGRALTRPWPIDVRLVIDGAPFAVRLIHEGGSRYKAEGGSHPASLELLEVDGYAVRFACDGLSERASFWRDGSGFALHHRGRQHQVVDTSRAASARGGAAAAGDGRVLASMNGRVVAVHVAVGDRVESGQPLLTLEAMKMEHIQVAPRAGTVRALHAAVGDQVAAGLLVAEVEAARIETTDPVTARPSTAPAEGRP